MAAETVKPTLYSKKINTIKQQKVLNIKYQQPHLSIGEVARASGVDPAYVARILQEYRINKKTLDEYKQARADIWLGQEQRILSFVSDSVLQKASAQQLLTSAAICADKYQEITTGINAKSIPMIQINVVAGNGVTA